MMATDRITIETPDGPMEAFSAVPASTPSAAVIVVQEAFGLTDHIGEICTRLAAVGYRTVAPAFFHRNDVQRADYSAMTTEDGVNQIIGMLGSLTQEGIDVDLDATIALLSAEGFSEGSTGIIGFCMGGAVALYAGTRPGVAGAVSFYGGGVEAGRFGLPPLIELAPDLRCDWLGLYGDQDPGIPVSQIESLADAVATSPVTTEVVRYADAGHGFNCNDRPDHFNAEAAADAWARTLDFLSVRLGG